MRREGYRGAGVRYFPSSTSKARGDGVEVFSSPRSVRLWENPSGFGFGKRLSLEGRPFFDKKRKQALGVFYKQLLTLTLPLTDVWEEFSLFSPGESW